MSLTARTTTPHKSLTAMTGGGADRDPALAPIIDLVEAQHRANTGAAQAAWTEAEERLGNYLRIHSLEEDGAVTSRIRKFAFWLATGRLPGYDATNRARPLLFELGEPETGWTPRRLGEATAELVLGYDMALHADGIAYTGRLRDLDVAAKFYTWLTDDPGNAVATVRRQLRKEGDARRATNSDQDSYYTPAQSARLLAASAHRITRAWDEAGRRFTPRVLKVLVEHTTVWLLWGTGASKQALMGLDIDDVDIQAHTINWRHGLLTAAGRGTQQHQQPIVRPIPGPLTEVLNFFLAHVRPRIASSTRRLLVNPDANNPEKVLKDKVVDRLTAALAETAGMPGGAEQHSPRRWARSYALRLIEDPHGSLIAVTRMHNRVTFSGTVRSYSGVALAKDDPGIDDVFGTDSLWQLP